MTAECTLAFALSEEEDIVLEFKEGAIISLNDLHLLEFFMKKQVQQFKREHEKGYAEGYSEGEMAGYKAGKDEEDPSKEECGKKETEKEIREQK